MDTRKEKDINLITDLTLGLVDTLSSLPGVTDVTVGLRQGAEKATIAAWEQRHGISLPLNLKQLYLTTDGFSLTWNYVVGGKTLPLGNLEILPLSRLNRVGSGRSSGDVLLPSLADLALAEEVTSSSGFSHGNMFQDNYSFGSFISDTIHSIKNKQKIVAPTFHLSKLFEIDNCKGNGKVVIAYPGRLETFPEASFWFIDLALRPHILAIDAVMYWRMVLVYLGMPQWQALAAGIGLTPWARQWYEIIAPHILEGSLRQHKTAQPELINKLDWTVFKAKRTHKPKPLKDKEPHPKDQGKPFKEYGNDSNKSNKDTKERTKSSKECSKDSSKVF